MAFHRTIAFSTYNDPVLDVKEKKPSYRSQLSHNSARFHSASVARFIYKQRGV